MSFHQEEEERSQSMAQLLIEDDASLYVPEDTISSAESSDSGYQRKLGEQRTKLNEFLRVCNTGITVSANKKRRRTQVCAQEEVACQKPGNLS